MLVRESVATIHQLRTEHRAKHDQWWEGEQVPCFLTVKRCTDCCVQLLGSAPKKQ